LQRRLISGIVNLYALDAVNTKMLKSDPVQTRKLADHDRDILLWSTRSPHSPREIALENRQIRTFVRLRKFSIYEKTQSCLTWKE
jgi:hypothetical protein